MEITPVNSRSTLPSALPFQIQKLSSSEAITPSTILSSPAVSNSSLSNSPAADTAASPELREAFQDFVGQTFFSEMLKAYRSSQQPSAYFNGGRAEEIFQGQLDQVLTEELSKSSAEKISEPMFDLFMLKRQS